MPRARPLPIAMALEGDLRITGLDIHRVFAEAVALEDGEYRRLGRIGMTRDELAAFAATLRPRDHVVVEATGNATAVLEILAPQVARVAVANPIQVHLIAKAKTKTDKIDARVLARLHASGFLPEVWIPDAATLARRRQVTRRNQLVKSRVWLKSIVQSILHANLAPRCPHADLFGSKGRSWLRTHCLPEDERAAIKRHLEEYDRQTEVQRQVERDIAGVALDDGSVKRLMTIPGIDTVVALGVMAAIGRIDRFGTPEKLVAYHGLNPSVWQSGDGPAHHGRISKRGRSHARHLLVEAAWQTVRSPGPLRAFDERVRGRRGNHVAAVGVARKLAILIWHMLTKGEDYAWGRPALVARKIRNLELSAGQGARRAGREGVPASDPALATNQDAQGCGRRNRGATMIRLRGGARTSRSALCHAVARDFQSTPIAEKGLFNLIRTLGAAGPPGRSSAAASGCPAGRAETPNAAI